MKRHNQPSNSESTDESKIAPKAQGMTKVTGAGAYQHCKIFPPIGIARVGNSAEGYFIGPEAPGVPPDAGGSFKDGQGRIKRQAARFRVYAFGPAGEVEELSLVHPDVESIRWKVSLANLKATWYQFNGAARVADILGGNFSLPLRNPDLSGADRAKLQIGPVEVNVNGAGVAPAIMEAPFSVPPAAQVKTVYLGEARTDEQGRLLVLGGRGESDTVWPDNPVTNYANNNGWHDDVSDGPVEAEVTFKDGTVLKALGRAWVVVAPPHYSPDTQNVVSLYDVLTEAALYHALPWDESELGPKPLAAQASFSRDIYPVLRRMTDYQWLNRRSQRGHAAGKRGDFLNEEILKVLRDPVAAAKPKSLHKHLFERLRTPIAVAPYNTMRKLDDCLLNPKGQEAVSQANLSYMPPLSGDEGDLIMGDPTTWLSLTESQYRRFAQWKEGDFVDDWTGAPEAARGFDTIPVKEQPASLTRAVLEACQGGAFYPGIEMTSIVRFAQFYREAFRVADTVGPGDVTKWMALPWQADFSDCNAHWWPSVRPDDVVPEWQLEKVIKEFEEEARNDLPSLLANRELWARGVGLEIPARPSLPTPGDKEDGSAYRAWCEWSIARFVRRFLRVLPQPQANELPDAYRRRLEGYLDTTILEGPVFSLPQMPLGTPLEDYRLDVVAKLQVFLNAQTALPASLPGETGSDYYERVADLLKSPVWQGLLDVAWAWRDVHRAKNDMISKWSRLGFVRERSHFGHRTLVETDRGRFDLISFRTAFFHLANIEDNPEFLPKARELADEYLAKARELEPGLRSSRDMVQYGYFRYDPVAFKARMEKIYEIERRKAEAYDPTSAESEALFRTPAHVVERIRQLAPFNQLDGSWLEHIAKSGPIDHIRSFLFEIWSDEIGNGDPAQNHANVYTNLLHSAGIYLPPLNSRAYSEHPDLWEASFSSPAYQSALSLFPESYYPELLGMTLYLEWEAIYLPAMVKLYNYHGYDSLFYRLHVAIDNAVNGHGARARDAVIAYLDHVRAESGDEEMQQHFRRIWDGYLAFRFVGNDEWEYRFKLPASPEEKMLAMLEEKRHYAQLNHGSRRLGPNSINDWFDEPNQFLVLLAESDLIVKGDAANSRIFALMAPTGVMYKVFTARDMAVWEEWINSLSSAPPGGALKPEDAMLVLVREFASRAAGVPEHGGITLSGEYKEPSSGAMVLVTKPVSWWFQINQPENFMQALAEPTNGWIIPGNVHESKFFKVLLAGSGRMSRFLSGTLQELGGKTARDVIIRWIADGCQIPGAPPAPLAAVRAALAAPLPVPERCGDALYAEDFTRRTASARSVSSEQRVHLRRQFYGPGGGACH